MLIHGIYSIFLVYCNEQQLSIQVLPKPKLPTCHQLSKYLHIRYLISYQISSSYQIKVHITKTGKENELNEVQIYTHCLACYSMLVDAEAEVAEAPIFMCKLFSLVSILTQ